MKTVLITGAARGIGKSVARTLASEKKYNIIINYNKSENSALELEKELKDQGINALAIKADISKLSEVEEMFNRIKNLYKGVDVLINNAGISYSGLFQDLSPDNWDEIFNVNVKGCFNTIHCALPYMLFNKKGVILNFSSIWGSHGASCEVSYAASKGAIEALTRSLALELAPSNIRVNAIAPGTVNTDMMKFYSSEDLKCICDNIPMMRMAEPYEIANLVSFLISDKNSYMTGQIISPSGGMCV
ncbi:elongation factor P 5-aminopentanone reductase [Peptoniphilus catoniae]|uniref:elongation factor P 5-aminopentanone reductase n=1 Tax=Peptoniphilus catoniae TaxID=1660341 RepID=UPI0010FD0056|nr:SDR family oxidoreductase [Peptoniphilus catoniae]